MQGVRAANERFNQEVTRPERGPVQLRVGRIGRYELRECLGEGGLGVVYAAYDPQLDRQVAIKLIRPDDNVSGIPAHERLLREARAIARLNHANVVEVFDLGTFEHRTEDGQPPTEGLFIVMQLLSGKTVETWLEENPSWEEILAVFGQAGAGLQAAHLEGVVHRDFKPANVFLCDDGTVKVLDFGLAKMTIAGEADRLRTTLPGFSNAEDSVHDAETTNEGTVLGTPAYMAPEQHVGELSDPASDQFAYCVALYKALFRVNPFAGKSMRQIATAKWEGRIVPPPAPCDVPSWVEDAVVRGLASMPSKRWASMGQLLDALARRRRPSKVRRVAAASLAAGVVGFALPQPAPDALQACEAGAERVGDVWSDGARTQLAAARPDDFEQLAQQLDTYAEQWQQARYDACQVEALDLQLQCLDARLLGLSASLRGVTRDPAADLDLLSVADCSLDP